MGWLGLHVPAGSMSGACGGIVLKSIRAFWAYLGCFKVCWESSTVNRSCPTIKDHPCCLIAICSVHEGFLYWLNVFLQHHMLARPFR